MEEAMIDKDKIFGLTLRVGEKLAMYANKSCPCTEDDIAIIFVSKNPDCLHHNAIIYKRQGGSAAKFVEALKKVLCGTELDKIIADIVKDLFCDDDESAEKKPDKPEYKVTGEDKIGSFDDYVNKLN
jgi:hypothetical protein